MSHNEKTHSLLEVRGLRIGAGDRELVHGVDLFVAPGEWLSIIGESGSGKTLSTLAIADLLPRGLRRECGRLDFAGTDLLSASGEELRRIRGADIAYVFQDYASALSPFYRVGAQMREAMAAHFSVDKRRANAQIADALSKVNLDPTLAGRYPFELSGGQLQRVVLAMALLARPRLVIADEPTTALDSVTQNAILELLDSLRGELGCAIVFVTHDLRCVRHRADTVVVMREGEIVEAGPAARVISVPRHPYTRRLFAAVPSIAGGQARLPEEVNSEG